MKGLGRRIEQTWKCLWALLHLLHFHLTASQITWNCTTSFCIWTCLPLHQPVYWHGADIGIGAQRISHVSEDGTQCCFIKDIWSLVVLQVALCYTMHQWYDKYINQVLTLLQYYFIVIIGFFSPSQITLFNKCIQCFHICKRKRICSLFSRFFGHMHRHTKNGVDCHFAFCVLFFDLMSFQD